MILSIDLSSNGEQIPGEIAKLKGEITERELAIRLLSTGVPKVRRSPAKRMSASDLSAKTKALEAGLPATFTTPQAIQQGIALDLSAIKVRAIIKALKQAGVIAVTTPRNGSVAAVYKRTA